jgi:T-complex protein 1 subunit theta
LSELITESCLYALPKTSKSFSVENVRVAKVLGGSLRNSQVIHGIVVQRQSETSIHKVANAKVAVFNTPISMNEGETKGTILIHNAEELLDYTKSEED